MEVSAYRLDVSAAPTAAPDTLAGLPFHLRFAVAVGLSARSPLWMLCELVDAALGAGLWDAGDLDAGLDAALDADDRGPLACALSGIFGGADGRDT